MSKRPLLVLFSFLLLAGVLVAQTPPFTLTVSGGVIPAGGAKISFKLDSQLKHPHMGYLLLGSASGSKPGAYLAGGFHLPLNYDLATIALLAVTNTPTFQNNLGILDLAGRATAHLDFPGPLDPYFYGAKLTFCAIMFDPRTGLLIGCAPPLSVDLLGRKSVQSENFTELTNLDFDRSGAKVTQNQVTPGRLGGTGMLGDFNHLVGSQFINGAYVFSTTNTTIPASQTLDGKVHKVTDGVFEFANFLIPPGVKVRFVGALPAKIFSRGAAQIDGTIDVSGMEPTEYATPPWSVRAIEGPKGGLGGAGGGRGGKGGSTPGTTKPASGADGADLRVPAGHPQKGNEKGTGGKGSAEFPPALNKSLVRNDYSSFMSFQASGPGGGGGFITKGAEGSITEISTFKTTHGTPPAQANLFPFYPITGTNQSIDRLLCGGSGGGGVGVCPWGDFNTTSQIEWCPGNGGGGGGGALAIRCGSNFHLTGLIKAKGGRGSGYTSLSGLPPGGSGSGGTTLVQVGGTITATGTFDNRGGIAGQCRDMYSLLQYNGAKGGDGVLRAEAPQRPSLSSLGSTLPPATNNNTGVLQDRDLISGLQSKWYNPRGNVALILDYYEIKATYGSNQITYTDNWKSPNSCRFGTTPVAVFFQGSQQVNGKVKPNSLTLWSTTPADLSDPTKNGGKPLPNQYRWVILLDQGVSGAKPLSVTKIDLHYTY